VIVVVKASGETRVLAAFVLIDGRGDPPPDAVSVSAKRRGAGAAGTTRAM